MIKMKLKILKYILFIFNNLIIRGRGRGRGRGSGGTKRY